jgi:hypothetical protein
MPNWFATYLLSLPERVVRSASAVAGGLVRELGHVTIPAGLRKTRLYQTMVEGTVRFLVEQAGEVEGVYPSGDKLAENFLARRTAGNGIEWVGILAFRASPVWVMAALADLSGAGRDLIREIARALKEEGLLDPAAEFETVDQILNGLEKTAGKTAETINTPPLDVASLRTEWDEIRRHAATIPLPTIVAVTGLWRSLETEAATQRRSVFELSSVMALSTVTRMPENVWWLGRAAQTAVWRTGEVLAGAVLEHYSEALGAIHQQGFFAYWVRQFRPYLAGAARQFDPEKKTLTGRLFGS